MEKQKGLMSLRPFQLSAREFSCDNISALFQLMKNDKNFFWVRHLHSYEFLLCVWLAIMIDFVRVCDT